MKALRLPCSLLVLMLTSLLVACSGSNTTIAPSYPATPAPKPLSVSDTSATALLGQPNFASPTCNNPGLTDSQQLCHPVGVAIDNRSGSLFVADGDNNRVLIWPKASDFTNGQAASVVLGQPNFTINQKCGKTNAGSLCDPNNLAVDTNGNLFVADTDGNRVLEFRPPFSSGMSASLVLGQPSFDNATCGAGDARLCAPRDVTVDANGNVWVVDADNNRVLEFDAPLRSGEAAHLVIGQSTFSTNRCNQGGPPSASSLCSPKGIALDKAGNLYVADNDNNRVLVYTHPLTSGPSAAGVFGEPNFTTAACSTSTSSLCAPHRVAVDASGQLIVSDSDNNRVLVYSHPLSSRTADIVFGQPNFTSHAPTTSATGLAGPQGIAMDRQGNLYLTDEDNNRVLRYDAH